MQLLKNRALRHSVLCTVITVGNLAQAQPLEFLSQDQRLCMLNSLLKDTSEQAVNACKMADATPLTLEQRIKLMSWFVTGKTGDEPNEKNRPATGLVATPAAQPLQTSPQAAQSGASNDEVSLAAQFAKWTVLSSGVKFERHRDGFSIDGTRYLDPEGKISAYGFDAQSGDFTYLAESGPGQFILKSGRATSGSEPIEIGRAVWNRASWSVQTATGKKFSGKRLIPLARGFVMARDNTGYRYVPGKGATSFSAPEQFDIAALQSGNVSGSGYILLERKVEEQGGATNSLGALIDSVKSLRSTLGIGRTDDYALLSIDSKKLVPINISIDDKRVQLLSQCKKVNFVMADCQRMDSHESLFQANGARNMTHYFWRINWLQSNGRPILVSQEGGLSKVTVTDLSSDKKLTLFDRAMGIASYEAVQDKDGKISVSAQLGFSTERKDDVVALLDSAVDRTEK